MRKTLKAIDLATEAAVSFGLLWVGRLLALALFFGLPAAAWYVVLCCQ